MLYQETVRTLMKRRMIENSDLAGVYLRQLVALLLSNFFVTCHAEVALSEGQLSLCLGLF